MEEQEREKKQRARTGRPEGPARALQIVVRQERPDCHELTALLSACGLSVLALLDACDTNATWDEQLELWASGRFRKMARRARASAWDAVGQLDGVTIEHGGISVRALVPTIVEDAPPAVRKLQLAGFATCGELPTVAGPSPLSVAVNPDLAMSPGKVAAQVGHAVQLARQSMTEDRRRAWRDGGYEFSVFAPADFAALRVHAPVAVRDAGFTEIPPGSCTTLALWKS